MEGECKVQLDVTADTEARTTQSVKPNSKLTTSLLVFTLCLAATAAAVLICNRHAKGPGKDGDNFSHTLRQISHVRAAIHLQGEYNPDMRTSVEWKNQVDQSHSQGGLVLDNNEIVIPQNGLYFVYSQASFRVSCTTDADDATSRPMVHLSHTVKRWSRSYGNDDERKTYETILHSVRTACQKTASSDPDQEGSWFSAVYMGAVFNLSRGDRLQTVMEEKMLPYLEDEPGKTFFGVFAL
ncbi:tumor necrosis factor a (TNF superfamily, member 2) [Dicentrarchus labrax]|uniref:Lymphotoxin-alpha n=1 Tax=Dicentrarchus labrax TaxID=13489 RepID=A0A8P4KQA4_DICLA|nr:tumor necrosis factor a (TNF superfamily, member 2) [Dicentrarchus labrax]